MKNATESKIVVNMKHIDHAVKIFKFIGRALRVADMGGDFYLSYRGAEEETVCIGHDVSGRGVEHYILQK